ncbi:MAG: hypothetical protein ACK5CW_04400 [Verrucomicrobiota bacterium]
MKTSEPFRRIAIGAYALPLVFHIADSLIRDPRGCFLILASGALLPAILYFCGLRWCRYVVGAFSVLFVLLWLVVPMAQHEIDRTVTFWFIWFIVLSVFIFSSIMSFTHNKRGDHAA